MDVIKSALQLGLKAQSFPAIVTEDSCCTYVQLLQSALCIADELKSALSARKALGLKSDSTVDGVDGSRVGIIAKPCAEFVVGVWATWLCQGIAVPLALSHPEAELLHVLTDADVAVVMSTPDYQARLIDAAHKCSAQCILLSQDLLFSKDMNVANSNWVSSLQQVLDKVTGLSTIQGGIPGLIVYTSGTTGKPKGVVHTHSGINAQVKMLSESWKYAVADRFLNCLPLHHVHGLFNGLLAPLYACSTVEFLPKFSVRGVWRRFAESYPSEGVRADNAITVFTGVPTMYAYLLQGFSGMDDGAQKVAATAARQLRLMMSGSSALPQTIMNEWETLTGHTLLERYGMTEFVMALSNPYDGKRKPGTVGKPLPGVQVKLVEEEDAASHGVGELYVKSPSLFKEYWRQPQVTRDSFGEDGYFKTGDSVTMDEDGYFIILGRSSVDILKAGGFKLSALEIEGVLLEHPSIAECAVLGVPDLYRGEEICAVVIMKDKGQTKLGDSTLNISQLQEWAGERLAPYKIPTRLEIWETMPRNAMGKVNKKELQKVLADSKAAEK